MSGNAAVDADALRAEVRSAGSVRHGDRVACHLHHLLLNQEGERRFGGFRCLIFRRQWLVVWKSSGSRGHMNSPNTSALLTVRRLPLPVVSKAAPAIRSSM